MTRDTPIAPVVDDPRVGAPFRRPHAASQTVFTFTRSSSDSSERCTLWMISFQVITDAIDLMCTMLRRARNRFAD